ncbi:MAG: hypothetical protein CVV64_11735 [Candidatus Wallbacteria bacterium HGW-Wallbacteria-1]|uniref:PKD domain-containing protein n=1 Tax=Candidatus Wallbacteria bacterium HGW-Wallbacteria-1 TaxID=2013854 RepID=A0A2N1PNR5_9BACT|nr:MAG: hypothetical protein CVV64_11735 [Candidatus Wallbacteria bacterium HGW-Wallbacteria-1]
MLTSTIINNTILRPRFRFFHPENFKVVTCSTLIYVLICLFIPWSVFLNPVFSQAAQTKTITLFPTKPALNIVHIGSDDESFIAHHESVSIHNCPPAAIIQKIRVYGFLKITGSASEFRLQGAINGTEDPALKLTLPGFMMDLFKSFTNNQEQKISMNGDQLGDLLKEGGTLTLEGTAQIRGPGTFKVLFNNLRAEVTVLSDTAIPFPKSIDIPPIIDPARPVPVTGKNFEIHEVFKDSRINITLLWNGAENLTKSYDPGGDVYEMMRRIASHKWTTAEFIDTSTPEGEHTVQWKIDYTSANEEGFNDGDKTLLVPATPKKIIVLKADSASDYFPTAFVNLYGPEMVDEDVKSNWSFAYQATFHKDAPNPVIDRTMARADAKAGILPESIKWSLDWGDGTEPISLTKHTPDQSKLWQEPVTMAHKYTVPGKYTMNMRMNYKIRRYKPIPNIEEFQSWLPVDTEEEITSAKSVDVADKTPPVIVADGYEIDAPPYGGAFEEPSDTGRDMQITFNIIDNCIETDLRFAKLHYFYNNQWQIKGAHNITHEPHLSNPGRNVFTAHFNFPVPFNTATKPPTSRKMPIYLETCDKSGNINDGDLQITDNDNPPGYGADGRGPSGSMVIYDSFPPSVKISYKDPTNGNLMEFATMSQRETNTKRVFFVGAYETPRAGGDRDTLFEEKIYDVNIYPIMNLREIRAPLVFPKEITIIEDQRLHVEVDCTDYVDQENVTLEFQIDGVTVNTSERGKATIPVIFRNPGQKTFSIIARDKSNMDNSFNAVKIDIKTIVKDSRMTVQTLQSR